MPECGEGDGNVFKRTAGAGSQYSAVYDRWDAGRNWWETRRDKRAEAETGRKGGVDPETSGGNKAVEAGA